MAKIIKRTFEQIKLPVHVQTQDIHDGDACEPSLCMQKVAIERALTESDPKGGDHKVRIDAGVVKFIFQGYRYEAITPGKARRNLLLFDKELKLRQKAEKSGLEFHSDIRPHSYNLVATRGAKVTKMEKRDAARLAQIRDAKREREKKTGQSDASKYSRFRKRVLGIANI